MFALGLAAAWFAVCAVLGAADWWRWRAPHDSGLVYGPTFEERTATLLGAYVPVITTLSDDVPLDAFVIVVLPTQPADPAAVLATRLVTFLGPFVVPHTLVVTDPAQWRARMDELAAGAPIFVLDLLSLVPPADDLAPVSKSDVHVLWRVDRHG